MSEIKLVGDTQREYAIEQIRIAPVGYVVRIGKETRTQAQNRLMWPLLADLQSQVPNCATQSQDQIKLRCLNDVNNEMIYLPQLYGEGMFVVGQRSSTLTKAQFNILIEAIFRFGNENCVAWSRKSQNTFDEVLAA